MPSPLLTAEALVDLLRADADVCLLDVRWRLDRPEGRPEYLDGHLPGAVYVDLDHELAERADPQLGRHPLPSIPVLQAAARRWGIGAETTVVAYDDLGSVAAARAWWVLTHAGVPDVRVLDGGLRGWIAADLPLETGDVRAQPGDVILGDYTGRIDLDDAASWTDRGVLLDVRGPDRYRGDSDPNDPVAGHIPGAANLPTTTHLRAGRFRPPEEIRRLFASTGVSRSTPVAAYCGSGIAATHTVLAGRVAGLSISLYPGSWSQWSRTPGAAVATGTAADPGSYHI